jgi:hypothetical protein
MNNNKFFCKIKVTNLNTKVVYIHAKVPYEHVEMLKLNPNLEVDILGQYRDGGYESRKTLSKDRGSITF